MSSSAQVQHCEHEAQTNPDYSELQIWGEEHLDSGVVKATARSKRKGEPAADAQTGGGPPDCFHKYYDHGCIVFSCRGAEFVVYAANVVKTSAALREHVETSTASSTCKLVIKATYHECEPYVLDRIIHFWSTRNLIIWKHKTVEFAKTPPANPSDADVTDTMTTTLVILNILMRAMTQLNDEHLKDAALSRLRSHINRKQISPREVLDTLDLIYGSSSNNEVVKVAKKMLLSALLKFRSAICVSALYPELQNLFNKYPALRFDDAMATSYKELCLEAGEG